MLGKHPLLEGCSIEASRLAAGFSLDQRGADRLDLGAALLLAADQIADALAVVRVVTCVDLCLDPVVLLIGRKRSMNPILPGLATL